jgi:two-component system cell cycle response regulator DivK
MAEGYQVEEAENAIDGIQLAQQIRPDLILMDISMPEMDGLTATEKIRNLPEIQDIPIIALTANALSGDKERTLQAGCDGYIGKPIDVDTFADEINAFLR